MQKIIYYYYCYYYDVTKFNFNNSLPHSVCHIISITIDNRDDPIIVIVFKNHLKYRENVNN